MINILDKIPLPSAVNKKFFVCVQNREKQDVCYNTTADNYIECEPGAPLQEQRDLFCKLNFRTTNPSATNIKLPSGIWTNFERGDELNLPIYYYLGTFNKKALPQVMAFTGESIMYKESPNVYPTVGFAPPPNKCKYVWNMLREDCRPYAESTQWKVAPSKGFPFVQWVQKEAK